MHMKLRNLWQVIAMFSAACLSLGVAQATPLYWQTDFGVPSGLTDGGTVEVPFGFNFNFLGTVYTSGYVSENGFLSLGVDAGNGCCAGNVSDFFSGPARISLAWLDWYPEAPGDGVWVKSFADRVVFTWSDVIQYDDMANLYRHTLQMQVLNTGGIIFGYLDFTGDPAVFDDQVLIGISPGGNASDPGQSNLLGGGSFNTSGTGTVYQLLNQSGPGAFGIQNYNIVFTPSGSGWQVDTYQGASTPEPATVCLMGAGLLLIGRMGRRRKR
jgi:hypothetical protein